MLLTRPLFLVLPDDLFCTAGCHPTRASELEQHSGGSEAYISELESLINAHRNSRGAARKVVAVGECGLDYDRLFFSPADAQKAAFNAQLHLARRVRLPLFLHSRAAHDDLVAILRPHMKELREAIGGPVGVVHSFDGSVAEMQELIGLGLYIGLNGCSLRTKENLEVAQAVPLNSLMIETDAPWCELRPTHASAPILQAFKDRVLPPPPAGANTGKKAKGQPQALDPASSTSSATDAERAQALAYFLPQVKKEKWTVGSSVKSRNEPAATGQVALVIAGLKNISVEEVAQQTTRNARSVFSL